MVVIILCNIVYYHIYVTGTESGIQNSEDGSCVIERKQGGGADGCADKSVGFDCTCAKLPTQEGEADDCDIIK